MIDQMTPKMKLRLIRLMSGDKYKIPIKTAKNIIRDYHRSREVPVDVRQVFSRVYVKFGVHYTELRGEDTRQSVRLPRYVAILALSNMGYINRDIADFLCRAEATISLAKQVAFGLLDVSDPKMKWYWEEFNDATKKPTDDEETDINAD